MKKYFTLLMLLFFNYYFSDAQQYTIVPEQFSAGYTAPIGIENCDDNRIFVVQQTGQIIICDTTGKKLSRAYLDISAKVTYDAERGLLGLAFSPNYSTDHYFYVCYSDLNGNTQVSRFRASYSSPDNAIPTSEYKLLNITQPFTNNKGGCIHFGPDGFLYIGVGDGDSTGDPSNYAQNPQSLLGKMLRIDPRKPSGSLAYTIPPNNPFVDSFGYRKEIWALGLQNPRHWSFDSVSGAMLIGDVGHIDWQELDYQPRGLGGLNYGWRCYEGQHTNNTTLCNSRSFYKSGLYQYSHANRGGCEIIGGYFYRGTKYSYLSGSYYFTDHCNGAIKAFNIRYGVIAYTFGYSGLTNVYSCFGEDSKHELYLAGGGIIYHITAQPVATEAVNEADAFAFSVTPNPSHGSFVINYKSGKTQPVIIHIQNMLGQQFYASKTSLNAGNNNLNLNVRIPHGDYVITITDASGKTTNQRLRIE